MTLLGAQSPVIPLDPLSPKSDLTDALLEVRLKAIRQATLEQSLIKKQQQETIFSWKLLVPILIIVAWILVSSWMFFNPQAGRSVFVLSDIRITGPTDLCPGDSLKFEFDVTVKSTGVYNLFMSTWKVDPPPSTVIFSELQPFVIGSPRAFPIVREWKIPVTYKDPANNIDTPMFPGRYIRDISVTAEGRDTRSTPLQVPFTIREGCVASGG